MELYCKISSELHPLSTDVYAAHASIIGKRNSQNYRIRILSAWEVDTVMLHLKLFLAGEDHDYLFKKQKST